MALKENYTQTLPTSNVSVWNVSLSDNSSTKITKPIISEHAATLVVNGEEWLTFICSPSDLEALAVGFLWNGGTITDLDAIQCLQVAEDGQQINVTLENPVDKPTRFHRTSTGITNTTALLPQPPAKPSQFKPSDIIAHYQNFMQMQVMHDQAGGFHSAGLSDGIKVHLVVEDLGRHNCVDKLCGLYLLQSRPFSARMVLLSGRISSEMVIKSLPLAVSCIVSRTTPTAAAVEIADQAGITLIGYLRSDRFEVYSHPENIDCEQRPTDLSHSNQK